MARAKETVVILFLDVKNYSKLKNDREFGIFFDSVLAMMAEKLTPHKPFYTNSWGDAILAAFRQPRAAAHAALDLRDLFRNTDWENLGLSVKLEARIALHAGSVFIGEDPIQEREGLAGHNINVGARIEPITQPNEVWVSEAAAALLAEEQDETVDCDPLGERPLAKQWGTRRLFRLRRDHEPKDTEVSDLERVTTPSPTDRKLEFALRLLKYGKSQEDRIAALKMLALLPGDEQTEEFLRIAADKQYSQTMRTTAIIALSRKPGPAVTTMLLGLLKDEHDDLECRGMAIAALGKVGTAGARDDLLSVLKDDTFPAVVKAAAVRSLGQLSEWSVYGELEATIEQLRSEKALEPEFAIGFVKFCRLYDNSRCLPVLVSLTTDAKCIDPLRVTALNGALFIGARWLDKPAIDELLEFHKHGAYSEMLGKMILTIFARNQDAEAVEYVETVAGNPSHPLAVTALALLVEPEGVHFTGEDPQEGERGYKG